MTTAESGGDQLHLTACFRHFVNMNALGRAQTRGTLGEINLARKNSGS